LFGCLVLVGFGWLVGFDFGLVLSVGRSGLAWLGLAWPGLAWPGLAVRSFGRSGSVRSVSPGRVASVGRDFSTPNAPRPYIKGDTLRSICT